MEGMATAWCPECGEVTEKEIRMPFADAVKRSMTVRCMCRCRREEMEAVERRLKCEDEKRRIDTLRSLSLMDAKLKEARFRNYRVTDSNLEAFDTARRYVENFGEMLSRSQGILFLGSPGTGKSYTAAAIANELIDRMHPVVMTSFIKLLDGMMPGGRGTEEGLDGPGIIRTLDKAELLVIDDFGTERCTDFSMEKVYDIIDSRYRSGKPVILTSNLELERMKGCTDVRYSRIYDRVFEMCYPVRMEGVSWRKKEAVARFDEMKEMKEGQHGT